jgi:ABC-type multidrug transport system ATPase subunit/pSer/pThr/pTyr-binding forkhead associated (FHA) protein
LHLTNPYQLKVLFGRQKDQVFNLTLGELIIGRGEGSHIRIEDSSVSRQHACLILCPQGYLIEDLGSSNGTMVNAIPLKGAQLLKPGDRIMLGKAIVLEFDIRLTPEKRDKALAATSSLDQTPSQTTGIQAPPAQSARSPGVPMTRHLEEDETFILDPSKIPPQLVVTIAGESLQTYNLTKHTITIGRESDNDIPINSDIISRHHARLEKFEAGYQLTVLDGVTNETYLDGRVLTRPWALHHNSVVRVGSQEIGKMVTMTYLSPDDVSIKKASSIEFGLETKLQLGRHPDNDIVLTEPTVSAFHAQVERVGQRYRVKDLGSSNGTFVNNQRIDEEVWVNPEDTIRIGTYRFVVGRDTLAQFDESGGVQVDALGLNKWVRKDLNILQNISLSFQPREFIVVVGQSGGGKSTLVDAISGIRPATHGKVLVNDIDVYKDFDVIRSNIGYVPQRDIIHMELTVYEALDYAAKLRMPPDTSPAERDKRIMEVLNDLDLVHRKDVQVSGLSGGQQKRVSIGVELLTKPGLFFLDEPTSGLDPGTETSFMQLMRRLSDQGRTIVLVTHATKNVMLADKVVFLARGGYLAWFGPPDKALEYFDAYRSDREQRSMKMEFDQIYNILEDSNRGKPRDWAERFQKHPAYQEYVLQPLQRRGATPPSQASAGVSGSQQLQALNMPLSLAAPKRSLLENLYDSVRQLVILSQRNIKILVRDRTSLILMLAAAPLISLLNFVIAGGMGNNPFDYVEGSFRNVTISYFSTTMYSILIGALSQMREFVKEGPIYKRERLVNLNILPYVLSKMWVAILLAFYQAAAFAIIHYLAYDMPGGLVEFGLFYITLVITTFAGMMMGLLASALAPNANSVPLLVIMLLMPQLVVSGINIPLNSGVTAITNTRWAFESSVCISGPGSDVAADPCWTLPQEERENLTIKVKEELECRCLGLNIFKTCNFPGLGELYDPAIDEPEPIEPVAIGDPPEKPVLPDPPQKPSDQSDPLAMNQYLDDLQAYQDETDRLQSDYESRVEEYQERVDKYQKDVADYQAELADWQIARNEAVGKAEGLLQGYFENYSWSFVNKEDSRAYRSKIIKSWSAQFVIILVLFALTLLLMKRKDKQA